MPTKFYLTALLGAYLSVFSLPAQDLSGKWTGFLDQSADAQSNPGYKVYWEKGIWQKGQVTHHLELNLQKSGDQIQGEYLCATYLHRDHYGQFALIGDFKEDTLSYTTTRKIAEKGVEKYQTGFCYNSAALKYYVLGDQEYLEGKWEGWDERGGECASAWVKLQRKKSTAQLDKYVKRNIIVKEEIVVTSRKVKIEIWDKHTVDGDIISLKLNERWLLRKAKVTKKKRLVKLQLDRPENLLTIYAENLGKIPPNTSAVLIQYDGKSQEVILNSDMGTSEAIKINWEQ